jgi:ABC-2 type transport system permease protein
MPMRLLFAQLNVSQTSHLASIAEQNLKFCSRFLLRKRLRNGVCIMSFKSFIKIFKTKIPLIAMYVGIFLMISLINTQVGSNNKSTGYVNENIKVAVIDNDNSELSKGLTTFLKENMKAIDIIETEEGMEDALFERVAEYIVIIPRNYENDLMAGKNVSLESKKVPDAYSAVYDENLINQYMTTYKTYYVQYSSEKSIGEIINKTNDNMKSHINVEMNNNKDSGTNHIENNFNFGAYVILACIIWGVAEVLFTFFRKNIADRINVSPVSNTKKNLSLVCYSLFYMIIVYFINVIINIAIFRGEMINKINIMRLGNMLCLAMVAAGIGFLISTTIKSKGGRAAAINVVALGFSFIQCNLCTISSLILIFFTIFIVLYIFIFICRIAFYRIVNCIIIFILVTVL